MVEPDRNGHPNLLQQVKKYLKSVANGSEVYAQHLHRLDRPVSGIVLFAKQKSVLRNLSEQFAQRKVKKHYQAWTAAAPALWQGELQSWHKKEKKKAVLFSEERPGTEKAILRYSITRISASLYLWDIELHTGKYHQIRAQLSAAGCPIIGDGLYGSVISYQPDAIALHASRLEFFHPLTNAIVTVQCTAEKS